MNSQLINNLNSAMPSDNWKLVSILIIKSNLKYNLFISFELLDRQSQKNYKSNLCNANFSNTGQCRFLEH